MNQIDDMESDGFEDKLAKIDPVDLVRVEVFDVPPSLPSSLHRIHHTHHPHRRIALVALNRLRGRGD